jgi:hypothetical protein
LSRLVSVYGLIILPFFCPRTPSGKNFFILVDRSYDGFSDPPTVPADQPASPVNRIGDESALNEHGRTVRFPEHLKIGFLINAARCKQGVGLTILDTGGSFTPSCLVDLPFFSAMPPLLLLDVSGDSSPCHMSADWFLIVLSPFSFCVINTSVFITQNRNYSLLLSELP